MSQRTDLAEYLGDAVYAACDYDGNITLHLNDHRSAAVVILEPSVMAALCEFKDRAYRRVEELRISPPVDPAVTDKIPPDDYDPRKIT